MNNSLTFIFPELILFGFAFLVLFVGLLKPQKGLLGFLTLVGIVLAAASLPQSMSAQSPIFSGMLTNDRLALFFRALSLFVAGAITIFSIGYHELTDEVEIGRAHV